MRFSNLILVVVVLLAVIVFISFASAAEVNRTVDFSWSHPVKDDPFLSVPILPMSIPYLIIEIGVFFEVNDEYYVDIPRVELYLMDPGQTIHNGSEIVLHSFFYEPATLTTKNNTITYIEFPYKDLLPDAAYFTGQTLNLRFKASTNAPGGYFRAQLGYIPLSTILNERNFPIICPDNVLLECRSFGYFEITNATNKFEVEVSGYTNKPTTMEVWGRNLIDKTNVLNFALNGKEWSNFETINATNTSYFIVSVLKDRSAVSDREYAVVKWTSRPNLDNLDGSTPSVLTRFQENLIAFVGLLVAAGLLFVFVGLAQRCKAKKRRKGMYSVVNDDELSIN